MHVYVGRKKAAGIAGAISLLLLFVGPISSASASQSKIADVNEQVVAACTWNAVANVTVRAGAGTNYASRGTLPSGGTAPSWDSSCTFTSGGFYDACGGGDTWWAVIAWNGAKSYVAKNCVYATFP
jgi:hypothetical protein